MVHPSTLGIMQTFSYTNVPAYNRGDTAINPNKSAHIGHLRNATLGAVGTVLTLSAASLGLLLWPRKTGAFGSELTVKAEDVPAVEGQPFHNIQGKFYLVRNNDGLLALYTKCPHLGCSVPYVGPVDSPQAFKCPCHGSMYDYDGVRTGGPAPRPMDIMAVTVDEATGNVLVNTGDISQRTDYAPSQAAPYAF